ncbi:MAG: 2-oxoacid:acceptor oxidoreductase family protein, partial [Candidatus Omnitrophica bacterium]|nr:2-oxoacid:acceptor oxidoreductase family protein [Candidatus Omnitrophota bacterium]MDD5429882.1 2-oxoacid:acceptor oxidoreductase family protein [Candidatus Omnitrophota bacterium]
PSLDKFRKVIKKGILVTNKDLIGKISMSKNITLKNLPLNSMALESGNIRVVNTIALGIVFPFIKPLVSEESIITTLKESFKGKGILKVNLQAFGKGLSLAG